MIRISIVGEIGSGKSHIAKLFHFPVFNADVEVKKIYRLNRSCFKKIKRELPKFFLSFPIKKEEIIKAILARRNNLKKITKIIHPEISKKMKIFLNKNKNKKIIILDVPLFLENKLNKKGDIIIFVQSKKSEIYKRLKKRKNFNMSLFKKFKETQLPLEYKKKKAHFILKNNFTNVSLRKNINIILKKINNE